MTTISTFAADSFIERLPKDIQFFLVHGMDEGLAHERSRAIVRKLVGADPDPLRLVRIEGEALSKRPEGLVDEAYAVSMFGGSRAIWIDAQGRDLTAALEPLFARPPAECAIIVKAAQLKKGHALRTAFERAENAAAIECYSDERKALGQLIDGEVRAAGLTIGPDARAALVEELGADRQTSRARSRNSFSTPRERPRSNSRTFARSCPAPPPPRSTTSSTRRWPETCPRRSSSSARYFADGGDADQLVARLVARLTLLHRVRLEMEAGHPFDAACQTLYVRLPLEARRALGKAAERWTSQAVAQRLPAVRAMSAKVRGSPQLSEILASRALWALASLRRPAQG